MIKYQKRVVRCGWMDRELETVGQTDTRRHGKANSCSLQF